MIFITLGTQKFQMNRLLEKVDVLVKENIINESVFAQTGYSTYVPKNFASLNFLDEDELNNNMEGCSLLITHSGVGSIIAGLKMSKRIIAFPRLKTYGEHVDNHQLEIAQYFREEGYILVCTDATKLADTIKESKNFFPKQYVPNNGKLIIKYIQDYVRKLEKW